MEAFDGLAPGALVARAESATSREMSNEALVSVLRSFIRSGRQDLARRLMQVLCRRVAGRTARHLDAWCVRAKERREDLTQDIIRMLLECIVGDGPDQEFWECRFWTCFDRRSRSLLRDSLRDRDELSLDGVTGTPSRVLSDPSTSVEQRAETALALEALPEPLRTAFYLKHFAGYKEEGPMPGEVTIAGILGVSGRTVRNYLQRAETILVDWRENHALS